MRKRLMIAAAMTLAALAWPAAAQAQSRYSFDQRRIGSWSIYGMGQQCMMVRVKRIGDINLSFGFAPGSPHLIILAENRQWTSIVDEGSYDVHVELGDIDGVMKGSGSRNADLGLMMTLLVKADRADYFAALRSAGRVRLSIEGMTTFDFPMEGSLPAIDYFEKCTRTLRIGPFAG